ncbi:MAG: polyprenyl synthetase family protein [Candidatus Omnitrophica bacterium]|nr:polyprenyl synthetase family protein [Candidatus Omnitrophota bacterium]
MKKKISKFLGSEKIRVEHYLDLILPRRNDSLKKFSAGLRYAVFSGGKRIRPILLLHAYQLCGGTKNKALPAAAAVELIHTFSLIQDDLPSMDNDDLRRGKPTLHRAYPEYTALLASDYLLILAFRQLIENYPAKISLAVIDAIGLDGLTAGQFLDLTHLSQNPTVKILAEIRQKKTAALFELVFKLGAMIAGAKNGRVNLFAEYGRDFGMAFQIRDDLADAEKTEPQAVMKKKIILLAGRMQKIEEELHLTSPILDYFRKFLQDSAL